MYLQSIQFENLRTFERAELELNRPGNALGPVDFDNVNLLLGDNGSGKTTVLKAAAIGILAPLLASSSGFLPYSLVRRGISEKEKRAVASLRAVYDIDPNEGRSAQMRQAGMGIHRVEKTWAQKSQLIATRGFVDRFESLTEPRWSERLWDDEAEGLLLLGYGSNRRVEPDEHYREEGRRKSRALRYSRIAGLFEESVTLVPLSSWLPRLAYRRTDQYRECLNLLDSLLAPLVSMVPEVDLEPSGDAAPFLVNESPLPFEALSDGYRAFIGWIGDLLYHLQASTPPGASLRGQPGLVLVDEIDLHLHPEWQQRVIPAVARAFPRLQFIFTSHSPLVVGTLRQANVFILQRDENGVSHITPSPLEVFGLSADQILTSEHFGLRSARADSFARDLQSQAQRAQGGDSDAALQLMRMMALGRAGEQPEEERAEPAEPVTSG